MAGRNKAYYALFCLGGSGGLGEALGLVRVWGRLWGSGALGLWGFGALGLWGSGALGLVGSRGLGEALGPLPSRALFHLIFP